MSKSALKKAISFLCILSLVLSVLTPLGLVSFAEGDVKTYFIESSLTVDFDDYKITDRFRKPYDSNGQFWADGYFLKPENGTLRYTRAIGETDRCNTSGLPRTGYPGLQLFPVSVNAEMNAQNGYIVEDTYVYALDFKYKVDKITAGGKVPLVAAYCSKDDSSDSIDNSVISGTKTAVNVYSDPALTTVKEFDKVTDGYVTETLYFSFAKTDAFKYGSGELAGQVKDAYLWLQLDSPTNGYNGGSTIDFDITIDEITVKTVATANFNLVDENGNVTPLNFKDAGERNTAVDFSKAEELIKTSSLREVENITWFRDTTRFDEVSDTANEIYTDKIVTEYYAFVKLSDEVMPAMKLDFTNYRKRNYSGAHTYGDSFHNQGYFEDGYYSIQKESSSSENYVLRYFAENTENTQKYNSIYVGNGATADGADLEDKALYKMTFYYMADPTVKTTGNVYFNFSIGGGATSQIAYKSELGYANFTKPQQKVLPEEIATTWTQVTLYNYVDVNKDNRTNQQHITDQTYQQAPQLYITVSGGKTAALLIDDIEVTKVAGGKDNESLIVLEANGEQSFISGKEGSALNLEPLNNTDTHLFKGFYTDKACTTAFSATTYPAGITYIYAKFEKKPDAEPELKPGDTAICDFETYPESWLEKVTYIRNDRLFVNAESAYNEGGKGLMYHYVPATDPEKPGTDVFPDHEFNSKVSSAAALAQNNTNIVLANDTWYKMTFRYKAEKVDSTVTVMPITSGRKNIWENIDGVKYYVQYTENFVTIPARHVGQGWLEGEITFKTALPAAEADALFLSVITTTRAETKVYFDDITVTKTVEPVSANIVDFEKYPEKLASQVTTMRTDRFVIDSNDSYKGVSSLRYNYDPANPDNSTSFNHEWSSSFVLYGNDNITVEQDGIYRVAFRYKAVDLTTNVQVSLITSSSSNVWGHGLDKDGNKLYYANPQTDYKYTIKTSDVGAGWKEAVMYFKADLTDVSADVADKKATPDALFMWVAPLADVKSTIYFDDISVNRVADNAGVIVYETNDEIGAFYQGGYAGDVVKAPDLSAFANYNFAGWFADNKLTTPFSDTSVKAGITKVYAQLIKPTLSTFSDYPESWQKIVTQFRYDRISIANVEGNDVLKYHYEPWMGTYTDEVLVNPTPPDKRYSNIFKVNDGLSDVKLVDGAFYKLSYRYNYIEGSEFSIVPHTGASDGIWSGNNTILENASYRVTTDDLGKGWKNVTLFFKADLADPTCNSFYIWLGLSRDETTTFYIDDVALEQLYTDGMGIFFNYGVSGMFTEYASGNIGELITYPEKPVIDNFEFTGWYLDEECTTPFSVTRYNMKGFYNLYAGWRPAKTTIFTFEGNISDKGINRSEYRRVNGNTVWYVDKFNPGANNERNFAGTMIMPSGRHYRLEKGGHYVVAVRYYTAELAEKGKMSFYFQTSLKDNVWGESKRSCENLELPLEKGVWKTAYFHIENLSEVEGADYLGAFVTDGEGALVYFDDITVTRVDRDEALVFYYMNVDGHSLVPPYKIVKKGSNVALPNVTKKDFLLKGFFKDEKYEEEFNEKVFRANDHMDIYGFMYQVRFFNGFEDNVDRYLPDQLINCDPDFAVEQGGARTGKYAMHRKGDWFGYQGFMTLPGAKGPDDNMPTLTDNVVYTISFWVRIEGGDHTKGAIRLAGTDATRFVWGTIGNVHNTVALADISDGEWHKITYTFTSATYRYALFVPGYINAWFDDIEIVATPGAETSKSVEVEEYVATLREDNKATVEQEEIVIPAELFFKGGSVSGNFLLIVIVAVGALLVVGGSVATFLVVKSKKSKGENK